MTSPRRSEWNTHPCITSVLLISSTVRTLTRHSYKPREYTVVDIHQPPVSAPLPDEPEAANPASKGKFKRFCKNLVKSKKQPRAALMVE